MSPVVDAAAVQAVIGGTFAWCKVEGGPFWMGSDRAKDDAAFAFEPDLHHVELPTFFIAQYAVTYQQFEAFLTAEDGYRDDRWWADMDVREEHRATPILQHWPLANHPRENVSWHESMAFCRWLSHRLGGSVGLKNLSNWAIRLPIEAEWEKAARGTDGRLYPWGDVFDPAKANTIESGHSNTQPVTAYAEGASLYGAVQMAGNVYEWCASEWTEPYTPQDFIEMDFSTRFRRAVKGGSWQYNGRLVRCAVRYAWPVFYRNPTVGFRIVTTLAEPH